MKIAIRNTAAFMVVNKNPLEITSGEEKMID
jgi:hypothetical protein